MNQNPTLLMAALALLSGCSGANGVWMLELAAPQQAEECVDEPTDWNLNGAQSSVGDPPSDWTVDDSQNLSNSIVFAQIIETSNTNAIMIWDETALPSVEGSKGKAWTFEWTGSTQDVYDASHVFGYRCLEDVTNSFTLTVDVTLDGDFLTGNVAVKDDRVAKYEESDRWTNDSSGPQQCTIPWGDFLEVLAGGGPKATYQPASNGQDKLDCASDPCTMKVEHHCTENYEMVGTRSGYNEQDAYDNVDQAGQPFGVFAF